MYKGICHHMVRNNYFTSLKSQIIMLTIKTKVYFTILLVDMANNVM